MARESDIVLFWIVLAIFVVLPSVMSASPQRDSPTVAETPPRPLGRRERRLGGSARRARHAQRSGGRTTGRIGALQSLAFAVVAVVVIFLGWLTWDKNVDYAWAATLAASARDQFQQGNLQKGHQLMSKAISKAPDVPIYYHNLSGIYDAYSSFGTNNPDRNLPPCERYFLLGPPGNNILQSDQPYAKCAEEAYESNLIGYQKNKTSPQAKLVLANSTLQLALRGDQEKAEEAIRYYDELTKMIPSSWPLHNALGSSYLRLGRPEEAVASFERSVALFRNNPSATNAIQARLPDAYRDLAVAHLRNDRAQEALEPLEKSLSITQETSRSAAALYFRGVAYQQLDELQNAVDSLEQSLAVQNRGPYTANAHRQLARVYSLLGDQAQAEEHDKLSKELDQR